MPPTKAIHRACHVVHAQVCARTPRTPTEARCLQRRAPPGSAGPRHLRDSPPGHHGHGFPQTLCIVWEPKNPPKSPIRLYKSGRVFGFYHGLPTKIDLACGRFSPVREVLVEMERALVEGWWTLQVLFFGVISWGQ